MIIINKNFLKCLLGILIIISLAFTIQISNKNIKFDKKLVSNNFENIDTNSNKNSNGYINENIVTNKNTDRSSITTTATPASEKTIIIDAGHGLPDERSRK